ncbi:MAG: hypothetical protein AAGL69_09410 [Pseudomonadota bacterium]
MTKDEAISATRIGAIAACVSAGISSVVAGIAILTDAGGELAVFNDPLYVVDVVFLLLLAFGMYRKSRTAAVLAFVYFLASKAILATDSGQLSGLPLSLLFLYFFGNAARGAFVFHRLERADNPSYRPTSKLKAAVMVVGSIVIVGLSGLALLTTTGVLASTRVLSGSEMSSSDIERLQEAGIVDRDEQIQFFYADSLTLLASGNVLTDRRVVAYHTLENGEREVFPVRFEHIVSVELEEPGGSMSDSIYRIEQEDPDNWVRLFLSTEQKGDEAFIAALRQRIESEKP